jgi:hypothetical protein
VTWADLGGSRRSAGPALLRPARSMHEEEYAYAEREVLSALVAARQHNEAVRAARMPVLRYLTYIFMFILFS